MLTTPAFDPDSLISTLKPLAFGIDLHWLPHVDGSLSLAERLKFHHPDIPVIFGGLSATYFNQEIMQDYPFVDYIVCGDSTEEPLRLLMEAVRSGSGFASVPNLVWRNDAGKTVTNGISFLPENLDYVGFDYAHMLKMLIKYRDPSGYLPFRNWFSHPVLAVFSCRGCFHNCTTCGGSSSAFMNACIRSRPAFRSPHLLAEDIANIARFSGAPVMIIGDMLQSGREYVDAFFKAMRKHPVKNELAFEFFHPPDAAFVRQLADSIENFNVELSPESHDVQVRKAFGKGFDNAELEASIAALVNSSCKRIDLFFMVGLPHQDYASVMNSVSYCGELLERFGGTGKLLPMMAPLAPFVDPGSRIFEEPEKHGYRLYYRSLKEHRKAMLLPSWKQRLNYETEWMSRTDIVNATYDGALGLIALKALHGIITNTAADEISEHIIRAREVIRRLDTSAVIDRALAAEINDLNRFDSLCGKHELDWHVTGSRYHLASILKSLLADSGTVAAKEVFPGRQHSAVIS
jgi:B12-binding domain/radical SAM domain protein